MLNLTDISKLERVLCIGAHSDDIEIGCGATMFRLMRDLPTLEVTWCVLCGDGVRGDEAREAAHKVLGDRASCRVIVHTFRDAHLPGDWLNVKQAVGDLRASEPDLVFAHRHGDNHQDHRLVAELVDQSFRNHVVYGYEIPKYDGDLGRPNVFASATRDDLQAKCRLLDTFTSQGDKHWFDDEAFTGLARIRGLECASPTGYAEGFYCRKAMF